MRPDPSDPFQATADEADLTAELAAMAGPAAEALLGQLASAVFGSGGADLAHVTWSDDGEADAGPGGLLTSSPVGAGEARLRTAEMRYRTLVEQIPAVTFLIALGEGRTEIYVSPHIEALLGFTQREWLEDPFLWYSRLHAADRAIWIEEFARGCQAGGPFRAECRFIARDGRIVWVRGEARLVKDDLGRPLFLQGVAFDITDSKRAQELLLRQAVRTTEERYRDVVQGIGAIFWEADARTLKFTFVSPQAEAVLGVGSERWIEDADFWMSLVHPDDRERVIGEWQAAGIDRADRDFEFRATRADGSVIWLQARIHVIADERGRPSSLLGFMLDVSDRKRAEEERARLLTRAEEARAEAEALNRVGHQLAAELDLDKLAQAVIDAATDIAGAELGAIVYAVAAETGQPARYAASGAARDALEAMAPRHGRPPELTRQDARVVRIDDVEAEPRGAELPSREPWWNRVPVRSYLSVPIVLRSGEVLGAMRLAHGAPGHFTERHERMLGGLAAQAAVALDNARLYTGAEQARRAAEAANRAKDEFLATLSHELRTPLTAVLGWARILRMAPPDQATLERGLAVVERNAAAQAQLIEDLLDVSRIIVGKLEIDFQPIESVGALVGAVLDSFRPTLDAKRLTVSAQIEPFSGPIAGDEKRLQQVVWNLLSNALKFTPEGGRIEITCQRLDGHVELRVSDSGKGIAPAFLPHLFDRFTQADATSTRAHGGLGLGLAIVRHLVQLHGGSVRADSAGEGHGATFTVRLPLLGASAPGKRRLAPPPRRQRASGSPRAAPGLRVLIVEDDADARLLLTAALEQEGAVVRSTPTVAAALATLETWTPEVVVCDIGMPERDGYAFIRALRRLPPERGGGVPALAVTAYASAEDRRKAAEAGFDAHLAKPIDPETFVELVTRLPRPRGESAAGAENPS